MYGMIHRGLRKMIIEQFEATVWSQIEGKLGTGPEHLISAQTYDDSLTLAMIDVAAEQSGQTVPEFLTAFGRYWIQFAEQGSYGAMMDFTGGDFYTFIENLDRMHQAVHAAMSEAIVPSFKVAERGEDFLRVAYRSDREGLEPFVTGLFEGLLDRFGLKGSVEPISIGSNVSDFLIRFAHV